MRRMIGAEEYAAHQIHIIRPDGSVALEVNREKSSLRTSPVLSICVNGVEYGRVNQLASRGAPSFVIDITEMTPLAAVASDKARRHVVVIDGQKRELGVATKAKKTVGKVLFTSNTDDYQVSVAPQLEGPARAVVLGFLLTLDVIREIESRCRLRLR